MKKLQKVKITKDIDKPEIMTLVRRNQGQT